MNKYLHIEKNLEKAIRSNKAVVGLELNTFSKLIPYPDSLNLALAIEKIIREQDCIPATFGVMNGVLIAGVNSEQMAIILSPKNIPKISTRDIAYFVSQKLSGTPTMATSMFIARLSGIKVLSTGAIGGVHRGAFENFDISPDLQELSATNVAIVCSGVNYIFDIPLTLEYLKTYGVPVIGYTSDISPAFYVVDENLKVEYRIDEPKAIASLIDAKWNLGQKGGLIVTNPVPIDCRISRESMEQYVRHAIHEAKAENISRLNFTSYMIEKIDHYTKGLTCQYIVEILKSNALLSCHIAKNLSALYVE